MDDLLDKFEAMVSEYERLCELWRAEYNLTKRAEFRGEARSMALMLCDFLIDNDATVTFPAQRNETPHDGYEWDDKRRNWFPVTKGGDA